MIVFSETEQLFFYRKLELITENHWGCEEIVDIFMGFFFSRDSCFVSQKGIYFLLSCFLENKLSLLSASPVISML